MGELLFYKYLKYHKEHSKPIKQRLFGLPCSMIVISLSGLLSGGIGIFLLFKERYIWAILAVLVEGIASLILDWDIERFQIKRSGERAEQCFAEWYQLNDWLKENSVTDGSRVLEIKERLEEYVEKTKATQKEKWQEKEKWLQVIAIPIMLVVANKIINAQTETLKAIVVGLSILIVVVMLWGTIKLVTNILGLMQTRKLKQMEFFVSELQGVLDLERFDIKRPEES